MISDTWIDKNGKEHEIIVDDSERQVVECWSRVMGYFRPTTSWNIGKRQEHEDRVSFKEEKFKDTSRIPPIQDRSIR